MTTTERLSAALPSFDATKAAKMEDRKRSLAVDAAGDDLTPSRKRLMKDENGQAMRMDAEKEKEVEVSFIHVGRQVTASSTSCLNHVAWELMLTVHLI